MKKILKALKFDANGLVPAVIQDYKTNKVLMVGYMNKDSLTKTIKEKKTCFWSRSRHKYWVKGETSGNFQIVKKIFIDCDGDTLLISVRQVGNAACHKGYNSCFYRQLEKNQCEVIEKRVFNPDDVYRKK